MGKKTVGGPLSRICYEDSNFLLEAMLPFVPVQFKLLLAMMIKWNEVQRILRVFQNPGGLASYGLEDQPFSFSKLMSELAACPNPKLSGGMEQMSQMMQMMQMMQNMPGQEAGASGNPNGFGNPNMQADAASDAVGDVSSNLSDTIDRIIAAYAEDAGQETVGAVREPADAVQEPVDAGQMLAGAVHEPADAGQMSADVVQESAGAGQMPADVAQDPLENLDIDQFVKEIFS